jgi:hypothetical protein
MINISSEEIEFCKQLAKGRFDRARERGSDLHQIGTKFSKYQDDIHGILSEWAMCKETNTFPHQVISPLLKTKRYGEDMGDVQYKGLNLDIKSTHHKTGELWTDVINNNVDAYVFVVVQYERDSATCDIKGVMMAEELHSRPLTKGSRNQFRKQAHCATLDELTPWDKWKEQFNEINT